MRAANVSISSEWEMLHRFLSTTQRVVDVRKSQDKPLVPALFAGGQSLQTIAPTTAQK